MKWKAFKSSTRRQWPTFQRDLNLTSVQKKERLETCKINWNSRLWKLKGCTSRSTKLRANSDSLTTQLLGLVPSTWSRSPTGIHLLTLYSNNFGKQSCRKIRCKLRRNKIWNHTGQSPIWEVQIQNKKVLTHLSNASRSVLSHRKQNYSRQKRRDSFSHRSRAAYRSIVAVPKQPWMRLRCVKSSWRSSRKRCVIQTKWPNVISRRIIMPSSKEFPLSGKRKETQA